jgi:F-box/leucine-rich repeat protein 2/20
MPDNIVSNIKGDSFLEAVAQHRPCVTTLKLGNSSLVSDKGLLVVARRCPGLLEVNATYCGNVTDMSLAALVRGCPKLEPNKIGARAKGLQFLTAVGELRPNLKAINLTYCASVTDEGLRGLAVGCHQLVDINLSHCKEVTDAGMLALASGCPAIETARLARCWRVGDAGVTALLRGCPAIATWDLQATSISDRALAAIAECGVAETVNIGCCRNVTEEGLGVMVALCEPLRAFNVAGCFLISAATTERMQTLTGTRKLAADKLPSI